MRVPTVEKAKLGAYQLKGVSEVWFEQLKSERAVYEYAWKFTQLANYALTMVAAARPRMNQVSNPKPQENSGRGSSVLICQMCDKSHSVKCLAGIDGFFGCGKSDHILKNCMLQASKSEGMGLHFYIAQVSFERDCGLVHYAMVRHEDILTSAPILTLPKGSDDYVVYCDISQVCLCFVLMQHEMSSNNAQLQFF
ncbi:hypothetical protein MTR67_007042 [Solanum verrucosum]|uniref:Retrotransposon gag domain-containing protein n=1 Tax=Solanum verrucosum TaxID=315347 RepID=A0AAF0TA84_SOLVR|nr:hypothetical protein MTR67_007042 [Solanum verrucosum]